ncbi:helix-turn-helix transcriptional regulator [Streptococcus suis]|nr:helix-turn-helix transcriptional regulator [Streptococcus suis]HEL2401275.1 helix-turn-helix transcriptional regulator [Streptococcus suis]
MKDTIENRLRELRQENKLTQDELALELNKNLKKGEKRVSKMTISNWENNKHAIKPDKAQKLAEYFGVPVGYLLGYSETNADPFKDYPPTPREFSAWKEYDYMQLAKTDLDFYSYEKIKKNLNPFLVELILNYSFCDNDDREIIRKIAKKFAGKDSVVFQTNNDT